MDLLHVPAPPGAFEDEVNPYFSCDFALKHVEICDLERYRDREKLNVRVQKSVNISSSFGPMHMI